MDEQHYAVWMTERERNYVRAALVFFTKKGMDKRYNRPDDIENIASGKDNPDDPSGVTSLNQSEAEYLLRRIT